MVKNVKFMEVILMSNVEGLGQKNEIKMVRLGYALNFLLPKKLAKMATIPEKQKQLQILKNKQLEKETERTIKEKKEMARVEKRKEAQLVAKKLKRQNRK